MQESEWPGFYAEFGHQEIQIIQNENILKTLMTTSLMQEASLILCKEEYVMQLQRIIEMAEWMILRFRNLEEESIMANIKGPFMKILSCITILSNCLINPHNTQIYKYTKMIDMFKKY